MCCLSIVKTENQKIVITHNRDEQWSRQSNAAKIEETVLNNKKIWMPKDSLSNGTWIGTDGTKAAAILNGFKENHVKKAQYKASRGTIIPQFLSSKSSSEFIDTFDPSGLEPFTLVLVDNQESILEYGWDEKQTYLTYLSFDNPAMYSSATLYNSDVQNRRKGVFQSFLNKQIDDDGLWEFHETKGDDHGQFINVDYNNEISTVAISQIVLSETSIFYYKSLLNQNQKQSIILNNN